MLLNEGRQSLRFGIMSLGVLLGAIACAGCGSDSSSDDSGGNASGGNGSGGNGSGGRGSSAGDECPNVVDTSGGPEIDFYDAEAVATDGESLFVLMDDGGLLEPVTEHIIYELVGNAFEEVARVPYSRDTLNYAKSVLVVTSEALLTDSVEGDVFSIVRIPRDGGDAEALAQFQLSDGFAEPAFLSDGEYVYFPLAGEEEDWVYRIPATGGEPERLDDTSYFMGVYGVASASDSHVYQLDGGINPSMNLVTIDTSAVPADVLWADYELGTCTTAPGQIVEADGQLYAGCGSEADGYNNRMGNVFRLDSLETDSEIDATPIYATESLNYETFVVSGDDIYFEFSDPDEEGGEGIYRVPRTGGESELVLPTSSALEMLVIGSNLYVTSIGCDLQQLPL